MIRAVIVDDEPLARDELAYLLKRTRKVDIIAEAQCLESALKEVQSSQIDVVFVDIQLSEDNGLDLARRLNHLNDSPEIVFATAYDEYALEAFELNAVDYLLKPFDEVRIQQTINKLEKRKLKNDGKETRYEQSLKRLDKLALQTDKNIVIIASNDILYITANLGVTAVVTQKQRYMVGESLISLERKLQHSSVIRIHRAYLVNIDAIKEIEPWFHSTFNLIMTDGERLPVSRTYVKALKDLMGI